MNESRRIQPRLGYSVKRLDQETVDLIRLLAFRHRVSQGEVIAEAVFHFEHALGRDIALPPTWNKPVNWR